MAHAEGVSAVPRPLRRLDPARPYFVTVRCLEERYLLRPDRPVNELLRASLEATTARFGLVLHAYVAMSNHLHLVVQSPAGNLPEAMQFFLSTVARGVNTLRNRRGPVWASRYRAQVILDEDALFDRVAYTLANPVSAGLVETAAAWPGLTSVRKNLTDGVAVRVGHGSSSCDGRSLADELRRREHEARRARRANGLPRPRVRNVLRINPAARPRSPKRGRQPLCFAGNAHAWAAYRRLWRGFRVAYREASARFRAGEFGAVFPFGSRPPWSMLVANVAPA